MHVDFGGDTRVLFDVRVCYPNAPSYRGSSIQLLYRRHEREKKREYGDRVREIEHTSFTPLIFATTGQGGVTPVPSILTCEMENDP